MVYVLALLRSCLTFFYTIEQKAHNEKKCMSFQLRCIGCVCCKRQDIGDLIFVYSMCFFLSLDISSSAIKPNPLTVNDLFFFSFLSLDYYVRNQKAYIVADNAFK